MRFRVFVCGRSTHEIRQVGKRPLTDGFYHPAQQASATAGAKTRSKRVCLRQ